MENASETDPAPIALAIGAAVRDARKRRQLSTRELAASISVSQPFISNIENGKIFPSLRTLSVIAETIGVSIDELLPARAELQRVDGTRGMRQRRAGEPPDRALTVSPISLLQAHRIQLRAHETESHPFLHDGSDFLYVLEGSLDLLREGLLPHRLDAGCWIGIDGTVPHRLRGAGDAGGTAFLVATHGHHLDETRPR
ncbi:helix-turn-helix domain-containing protein [Naumannella halotolerans]|uniref:Transcriptional regulator with XRE-family HTH domain n=1 Tax=Naumannella halotolerans TaxID=993414 RepID=A0A4R7J7X9_9ACTN|nr:XRE family transcriptional regulator [Naumannella halotolerans]TDT33572.1 transcriptional regulator with XRE-family HTH domain [Naumannella halotolerans]